MTPTSDKKSGRHFILVVDNDGESMELLRANFRDRFPIVTTGSVAEARTILASREIAAIFVEYAMTERNGLDFLEEAARIRPGIIGALMGSAITSDTLLDALNRGIVWKFISKPWEPEEMETALDGALKKFALVQIEKARVENLKDVADYYRKEIAETRGFEMMIGEDGDLAQVMDRIRGVAGGGTPVLIRGERGVGKELIARTIYRLSDRVNSRFVRLDAASAPKHIVEEELFGRDVEGDFAPLLKGRIEFAEGGATFIENVELLSPEAQFRLADFLRTGSFERVGGAKRIKAAARVIAATTGDLASLAASRSFRSDLLDILGAYQIVVPPLRRRQRDISALAAYFADRAAKKLGLGAARIEEGAMEKIKANDWRGNLPELERVISLALLRKQDGVLGVNDLYGLIHALSTPEQKAAEPVKTGQAKGKKPPHSDAGLKNRLAEMERDEIIEAVRKSGGKKTIAARALGINRSTLYYRMKKHGIAD